MRFHPESDFKIVNRDLRDFGVLLNLHTTIFIVEIPVDLLSVRSPDNLCSPDDIYEIIDGPPFNGTYKVNSNTEGLNGIGGSITSPAFPVDPGDPFDPPES